VAFFLLKDGAAFRRTILLTLPRGRLRGRGAEVFEDINDARRLLMSLQPIHRHCSRVER
jgi:hypothetical protein